MSQSVKDELAKLGGQVQSAEGTRALALELCREFEDTFLQHLTSGEVRIYICLGCETPILLSHFLLGLLLFPFLLLYFCLIDSAMIWSCNIDMKVFNLTCLLLKSMHRERKYWFS